MSEDRQTNYYMGENNTDFFFFISTICLKLLPYESFALLSKEEALKDNVYFATSVRCSVNSQ